MNHHPPAQPVVMMVHAHPDDESSLTGGTLARCAAAGYRTVLVTCTDGGQGDATPGLKPGQQGHDSHLVAAARSRELDLAAATLGVHAVIKLGYPDSGVSVESPYPAADVSFATRPLRPMLVRLVRVMRLYRPDVVVTYPANGLSAHPDHIRTHELVVAAHRHVIANSDPQAPSTRTGDTAPQVPKLYFIALSKTRLRAVQDRARAALGPQTWVPPDAMAVDDAHITTAIDVTAFWPAKLRALAAHASQSDAAALLRIFTATEHSAGLFEEYVRAYPPPPPGPHVLEHGFFDATPLANSRTAGD
jgi:LmbE family N-acetylglucosaminyl deacetylase